MKNMSTKTITVCDVCKKEAEGDRPTHGWAHMTIGAGWCGPHPFLSGPHANPHDSVSRDVDVCSAECALTWLHGRIEKMEANAKEWAEWHAGERKREEDKRRWAEENDKAYKKRLEDERMAKEAEAKAKAERDDWVDRQRAGER